MNLKLTIELVPSTSWYTNVRSKVSPYEWDIIRKKCYKLANNRCEICSGRGPDHAVECHEVWDYDDKKHKQTLTGLIALCPKCHQVKHIGLASINGHLEDCIEHLSLVNNTCDVLARMYVRDCMAIWEKRSLHNWKVDITYLKEYLGNN